MQIIKSVFTNVDNVLFKMLLSSFKIPVSKCPMYSPNLTKFFMSNSRTDVAVLRSYKAKQSKRKYCIDSSLPPTEIISRITYRFLHAFEHNNSHYRDLIIRQKAMSSPRKL